MGISLAIVIVIQNTLNIDRLTLCNVLTGPTLTEVFLPTFYLEKIFKYKKSKELYIEHLQYPASRFCN
jgi:hypothetical protein